MFVSYTQIVKAPGSAGVFLGHFYCRMILRSWGSYQVYRREDGKPTQALKGLLEWKGIRFRELFQIWNSLRS